MKDVPRLLHDRGLFDVAFAHVRDIDPSVHEGAMFGCPAAFVGAHMAFCVYGSGIGIKLPAERAAALVRMGRAFAFSPTDAQPCANGSKFALPATVLPNRRRAHRGHRVRTARHERGANPGTRYAVDARQLAKRLRHANIAPYMPS